MASSSHYVPPAPTYDSETIILQKEGHDTLEVNKSQITPAMVARAFDLEPSTVWLKEHNGNRAFFPDANNQAFLFGNDVGLLCYEFNVEGAPAQHSSGSATTSFSPFRSHSFTQPSPGVGRNSLVAHCSRKNSEPTINVKVVQAKMKRSRQGKAEFTSQNVVYIDVTQSTANVNFITNAIQNKWGLDHIIVSSEGLPIEDSSGTQGLKFWKVGSRKLFAVRRIEASSRKRLSAGESTDEEESEINAVDRSEYNDKIRDIHDRIESLFRVDKSLSIPIALRQLFLETFLCHICREPMKPPIIFTKCCRFIVGCQSCVDTWYGGDGLDKPCPRCRAERGFTETCPVRGLDDFLKGVAVAFADQNQDDE